MSTKKVIIYVALQEQMTWCDSYMIEMMEAAVLIVY